MLTNKISVSTLTFLTVRVRWLLNHGCSCMADTRGTKCTTYSWQRASSLVSTKERHSPLPRPRYTPSKFLNPIKMDELHSILSCFWWIHYCMHCQECCTVQQTLYIPVSLLDLVCRWLLSWRLTLTKWRTKRRTINWSWTLDLATSWRTQTTASISARSRRSTPE